MGRDPTNLGPAGGGFALLKQQEALCLKMGNQDSLSNS